MTERVKQVGPNRYRESYGRYYEDFEVGHIYEHRPGRTMTETDNIQYTLLTMNTHPLHFDAEYCRHTEFGKPLINSTFTLSVVAGMSVSDVSQKAIANLGWSDIKLTAPVFAGDTLWGRTTVLSKTPSASKPDRGVVEFLHEGLNQKGEIVARMRRKGMMMTRPK